MRPPPGRKINKPLSRFGGHNTSVVDSLVLMMDSVPTLWVGFVVFIPRCDLSGNTGCPCSRGQSYLQAGMRGQRTPHHRRCFGIPKLLVAVGRTASGITCYLAPLLFAFGGDAGQKS